MAMCCHPYFLNMVKSFAFDAAKGSALAVPGVDAAATKALAKVQAEDAEPLLLDDAPPFEADEPEASTQDPKP